MTYFEKNQVLAWNWRVRYDAKAILSYITTVVHFPQTYYEFADSSGFFSKTLVVNVQYKYLWFFECCS